jgi:hypothetical protein
MSQPSGPYNPHDQPPEPPPLVKEYSDLFEALVEAAKAWDRGYRSNRGLFAELLSLQALFVAPRDEFDLAELREGIRQLHAEFGEVASVITCKFLAAYDLAASYEGDDDQEGDDL